MKNIYIQDISDDIGNIHTNSRQPICNPCPKTECIDELVDKHNEIISRSCTRSITFKKINKDIVIGDICYEICNDNPANVLIDSIEFVDGNRGNIDYTGCNSCKPNLAICDFSLKIPCHVSAFIVKISINTKKNCVRAHWWIDLKIRCAVALSIVQDGVNPDYCSCFKNTSAGVVACNKHPLPSLCVNNSNLKTTLTDKDTIVCPYNICLFSSNCC